VRWEANHTNTKQLCVWWQRRQAWSATRVAVRVQGEETPCEPKYLGGNDEEEDEDEEEGEVTPNPTVHPLKISPHLTISSASKWGPPLACVSQNNLRRGPGHRLAHLRSPVSCWYLLAYRG
jgi:hypothetical protein